MKRCIFHYPGVISTKPSVGSELRPSRMLQALKNLGYEVTEITGTTSERAKKIKEIKTLINNGVTFDFVYAENRNIPTILSDDDHIPRHPFADFQFLKFCAKKKIAVGLFYRDCHWAFKDINKSVPLLKRLCLDFFIKHELIIYKKYVKKIYLPSEEMHKYVFQDVEVAVLPPGGATIKDLDKFKNSKQNDMNRLSVFYVGGVYGIYDLRNVFEAVSLTDNVNFTVCTVKEQWESVKDYYAPYMNDRITIVHEKNDQLKDYYQNADLTLFLVKDNEYANMAMPIKVFESISYGTPIIVSNKMAIAKVIRNEECGWIIDNNVEGIKNIFEYLNDNKDEIDLKTHNTIAAAKRHSWEARVQQIVSELFRR